MCIRVKNIRSKLAKPKTDQNRTKSLARGVELLWEPKISCRLETASLSRGASQSS